MHTSVTPYVTPYVHQPGGDDQPALCYEGSERRRGGEGRGGHLYRDPPQKRPHVRLHLNTYFLIPIYLLGTNI